MKISKLSISILFLLFSIQSSYSQDITDMLENTLGTVVTVAVYKNDIAKDMLGFRGSAVSETAYLKVLDLTGATSTGSGFVIQREGKYYAITNAHVIEYASDEEGSLYVFSINRNKYEVKVVGGDTFYDIAVLEFVQKPGSEIVPVDFRNTEAKIGETVYAIGNPLGEYPYSVSNGIISAKNRVRGGITGKFGFLQTTATVIWGNSGGPLIDLKGNVLGINSQIAFATTPTGDALWQSQINFALEGGLSKRLIDDIIVNDGRVKRAFLGVELSQTYNYDPWDSESTYQLLEEFPVISGVIPKSAAFYKLIDYVGYSVKSINNNPVRNLEEALGEFEKVKPGEDVTLVINKGYDEKVIKIESGELKTQELESIANFVVNNNPDLEFSPSGTQFYLNTSDQNQESDWEEEPYSSEEIPPMKKKTDQPDKKPGYKEDYRVAYDILGAGVSNDYYSEVWLVDNLATLGAICKLSGLLGFIDFFVLEPGASEDEIQTYTYDLANSDSQYKTVLWY
jgi:S1-C subfamily serine protease